MNPAVKIWGWALATCTLVALIISINIGGGLAFFILLIVALASLGSLLGFQCIFALLRYLRLLLPFVWVWTLTGIPLIVAANAFCLLTIFDDGFMQPERVWSIFYDVYPVTLIPLIGALAGTLISYRHINALAHQPQAPTIPESQS